MKWLDGIIDSINMSLITLWEIGKHGVLQFMGPQRVRHNWVTEQQHVHLQVSIDTCISLFHQPKGPGSKNTPVAASTYDTWILIAKFILQ